LNDWLSYRPGDFLMFSPQVYLRLFETVNGQWWPLHKLLLPAGLLGLWALARGQAWRLTGLGLGLAWLFCGVVFLRQHYEPIHWIVGELLPALLLLALLLPLLGWVTQAKPAASGPRRPVALLLGTWALLLHPVLPLLGGQAWRQAEWWALTPDPTAIATLAWLLMLPRPAGPALRAMVVLAWLLALAWCGFSAFMLLAMERWQALVPAVAVLTALLALAWPRPGKTSAPGLAPRGR
jgi:hypothetical protein